MSRLSPPPGIALPWLRPIRRSAAVMLVLAGLAIFGWLDREPFLRGAADLWIVSDPVTRADAIAIFGGGPEVRPFVAAELYRKGLVNKILVSQVAEEPPVAIGAVPSHSELNRAILLKLGVPDSAIEKFGTASKNTRDEAVALREWADRNSVSVLIVPTEVFSARRVRWMLDRAFVGKTVRIEVPSFESPRYNHTEWWKTEHGVVTFQNEVLKYLYYRLKY